MIRRWIILALLLLLPFGSLRAETNALLKYRGVNLAGAEFGSNPLGVYGVDYIYPTIEEIDYFKSKQMDTIRLPFRWERLQPVAESGFDAAEWGRLDTFVQAAVDREMTVILDPHNYGTYYGRVIGTAETPNAIFDDFWQRLATVYASNEYVVFGLMNEPVSTNTETLTTEQWLGTANSAIAAIRSTGANNLILVPGVAWTSGHAWFDNWYGTPNADVMDGIVDSGNNFAIEIHQYLDADGSGSNAGCVDYGIGVYRLSPVTTWLREHNLRGFLGEFAATPGLTCGVALNDMLFFLERNTDVWIGWTWWAAGPWWGDYMFSIEPYPDGTDRDLINILNDHIYLYRRHFPIIRR